MILLDNSQTLPILVLENTNGLGRLQPIRAIVEEELNGIYELNFDISTDDKHFKDMAIGGLIKVNAGEKEGLQIFRIERISKPINQIVNVYARHITYDLSKVVVKPFNSTGASGTVTKLKQNIIGNYEFNMTTNISNTTSAFTLDIPRSFRECLGGYEGSFLDVFKCEYEWDNITVKALARRGADTNIRVAYGKNLTDLKQEESIENVYDACLGYYKSDEKTVVGDIQYVNMVAKPRTLIVDFSNEFGYDTTPTKAQINTLARNYATDNKINEPKVNLTVSFVPLWQTEEYKNVAPLERVGLGDRITVDFPKLNVSASARVVKRTWNVLLERYESLELGNAKANLTTAIQNTFNSLNDENKQAQDFLGQEMNQLASLIINGLGLHKTLVETDGGGYRYYLHNKPTLAESDTQYIFTSEGFLVSTDYGQTFNAGFDSQGNAVLNSLATITLKALDIYGSRITFGDINDKYITAQQYVLNNKNVGISFDGNGYVRFQPTERFQVLNQSDNNIVYNKLLLERFGTNQSRTIIQNIDYANGEFANSFDMYADHNGNNNYASILNRNTFGSNPYFANAIEFEANLTNNQERLTNYKLGSNDISNQIRFYNADQLSMLEIKNYNHDSNTNSNFINFVSNNSYNNIGIHNYDSNGQIANSVSLNASRASGDLSNTITLTNWQNNSSFNLINMNLGGIYLNTQKDIHLDCNDDVYINGFKLIFAGDGTVKWV